VPIVLKSGILNLLEPSGPVQACFLQKDVTLLCKDIKERQHDQLAKVATRNSDIAVSFNRIPTSTLPSELKEVEIRKWQTDWDKCTKAAITKEFFPNVRDRLNMKISINPNFTAMVTGHGRTRAYRHRFRLTLKTLN